MENDVLLLSIRLGVGQLFIHQATDLCTYVRVRKSAEMSRNEVFNANGENPGKTVAAYVFSRTKTSCCLRNDYSPGLSTLLVWTKIIHMHVVVNEVRL